MYIVLNICIYKGILPIVHRYIRCVYYVLNKESPVECLPFNLTVIIICKMFKLRIYILITLYSCLFVFFKGIRCISLVHNIYLCLRINFCTDSAGFLQRRCLKVFFFSFLLLIIFVYVHMS